MMHACPRQKAVSGETDWRLGSQDEEEEEDDEDVDEDPRSARSWRAFLAAARCNDKALAEHFSRNEGRLGMTLAAKSFCEAKRRAMAFRSPGRLVIVPQPPGLKLSGNGLLDLPSKSVRLGQVGEDFVHNVNFFWQTRVGPSL